MSIKLAALNVIEAEYKQYKLYNQLEQARFLLAVNWNEINDERLDLGLPKITNDSTRKAYLRDKFSENNEKELSLELRYNAAMREYYDESNRQLQDND